MFMIERRASNRLEIQIGGKLQADDMRQLLDALEQESEGMTRGQVLYRIHDLNMPSAGAIVIELRRLPVLIGLLPRFGRIAVVSHQRWIQHASELEGLLLPGLSIKAFEPDDIEAAQAWLTQTQT